MPTEKNNIRQLDESAGFHPELNFILKLSIKKVEVPASSIINVVIKEWITDVLPRIEIDLSDNGRFIDQFPFEDNDVIRIELNHFIFDDPPIKMDFILQDYVIKNSAPGKSQQALITLSGLLKTNEFTFSIKNRSFSNMNSMEVFKAIFNESKITKSDENGLKKFDNRVTPSDNMNWLQINQNNMEFTKHVLTRSFVDQEDTPFLYTTRNGLMVHTSLNTELNKKQQDIIQMSYDIRSATLNSMNFSEDELEDLLEDEKENEGNNSMFFYNWYYKNCSGYSNKSNSYGRRLSYYDLTNDVLKEIKTDIHKLSTHSLKELDKIGIMTKQDDYGILDTSNVHSDYMLAKTQNKYLKEDFFSSYLVVYTRPSNNLNLFDRVNIRIESLLPIESVSDEVHSGQYIVGGIIHQASKNSLYNTIVVLFRNGLNVKGLLKDFESRHSSTGGSDGISVDKNINKLS